MTTITLATELTATEAANLLIPEVTDECRINEEASDVHTLADYMADVVSRFQRMLDGEGEALGFGPPTFTAPAQKPPEADV